MDAAQWSQQVASVGKPIEVIPSTTPKSTNPNNPTNSIGATQQQQQQQASLDKRSRPQKDQIVNCPRCNSTNTKFCYYNNYSLTQPRYFCKTCRRYWTQGGSLRSVPVGGGSRKNKRSSFSTSSTPLPPPRPPPLSSTTTTTPPITSLSHLLTTSQNPNFKFLEGQDLNLSFPIQGLLFNHQLPKNENYELATNINGNTSTNNSCTTTTTTTTTTTSAPALSALELLRNGIASRGSLLNPFVPMHMQDSSALYQSGYPNMQEFKPSMNMFSSSPSHHEHNNNINMVGLSDHHDDNTARLLFPFADMNKLATNTQHHDDDQIDHDQSKGSSGGGNDHLNHNSGLWSGMLGGGAW